MAKSPRKRRTYKLPRKVVKWVYGHEKWPGPGWIFQEYQEQLARAVAITARRSSIYTHFTEVEPKYGPPNNPTRNHFWVVLDAPDKPEVNRWGEVSP